MPWCVQSGYCHISDTKRLTIFSDHYIKIWIGERTKNNGCFGFVGQGEVSTDKIGVKMRFKNILDRCIVFLCALEVRFHLTKGVNHSSFAVALDIVGPLRQTTGIDLFYNHIIDLRVKLIFNYKPKNNKNLQGVVDSFGII